MHNIWLFVLREKKTKRRFIFFSFFLFCFNFFCVNPKTFFITSRAWIDCIQVWLLVLGGGCLLFFFFVYGLLVYYFYICKCSRICSECGRIQFYCRKPATLFLVWWIPCFFFNLNISFGLTHMSTYCILKCCTFISVFGVMVFSPSGMIQISF